MSFIAERGDGEMSDNMDMPLESVVTSSATPVRLVFDDEKHEYRFGNRVVPSVTQIMKAAGVSGDFRFVDEEVLETSRIRGRAVHDACAKYLEGETFKISELPEAAIPYFDSFLEWRSVVGMTQDIETLDVEEMVYDPELGYAGRFDATIRMGKENWLVDFKTRPREKHDGIQLGGYARAIRERRILAQPDALGVLELKKNGSIARMHRFPLERSIQAWEAIVDTYDYLHGGDWRYEAD